MNKYCLIFFLLFVEASCLMAQSNKDRLKRLNRQLEQTTHETTKIRLLDTLAMLTNETDAKASLAYSRQQLSLAEKIGDKEGIHKAYYNVANIIASENKIDSAVYFAQVARRFFLKQPNPVYAVKSTYLAVIFLSRLGRHNEATPLALANMAYADSLGNPHIQGIAATTIGILYNQIERPNDALLWFDKALKQLPQIEAIWEGKAYFGQGIAYRLLDKDSLAIVAFEKALKIFEPLNSARQTLLCLNALGEMHSEHAESKQAIVYYEKAIALCKATNQMGILAIIYPHCAADYIALKQFDKAEAMYKAALPMIETMPTFEKIKLYESLSNLKLKQGNPTEALKYMNVVRRLEVQKFTDNNNETDALIKKHAVEKQEQENALLQSRNRLYIGGLVALLVLIGIGTWAYWRLRQQKTIIEAQRQSLASLNNTKDKLFAILSHDLMSPVAALKNYTMLMDWGAMNQEAFSNALQRLKGSINHTHSLLENVLHWAVGQMDGIKPKTEDVDLASVVNEQVAFIDPIAKDKRIEITQLISDDFNIPFDKNHLTLILRNLLQNALKFTNTNGKIMISTTHSEQGQRLLSITDNGVGMSEEIMSKLFNVNENTHRKGTQSERGTGLGLILTKELIELNGGKIEVTSELNKGTTFVVSFKKKTGLLS